MNGLIPISSYANILALAIVVAITTIS